MTIKFWDRFLAAIAGLIILFLGVCLLIMALGIFPFELDQTVQSFIKGDMLLWQRIATVGGALVLVVLGFHSLSLLFRRGKDRGFIMQHTEYGDMSISLHAMENMVKKCVDTHEELRVTRTRIHRSRDGVVVGLWVSLASGVNIPLTVNALQKQIKHYITSCSGVDVKEVRVMVETGNHAPKSAEVIAPDMLAADASVITQHGGVGVGNVGTQASEEQEPKESLHQRLFKHEDKEPHMVPEPPADTMEETKEEMTAEGNEAAEEPQNESSQETADEHEIEIGADHSQDDAKENE